MTDPVTAVALGSMALKAGGSVLGGVGTANADTYKAQELDLASQEGTLKATQTNAGLTRNLSNTLANIDAVRASAHTDITSPTGAAVRGQTEATASDNKGIQVGSIMAQASEDAAGAAYMRSASSTALLGGLAGGLAAGIQGVAGLPALSGG